MQRILNIVKLAAILLLSGLIVVAIVQNLAPAPVQFLGISATVPVIAVIIVSLAAGFVLGMLAFSVFLRGWRKGAKDNPKSPLPGPGINRKPDAYEKSLRKNRGGKGEPW